MIFALFEARRMPLLAYDGCDRAVLATPLLLHRAPLAHIFQVLIAVERDCQIPTAWNFDLTDVTLILAIFEGEGPIHDRPAALCLVAVIAACTALPLHWAPCAQAAFAGLQEPPFRGVRFLGRGLLLRCGRWGFSAGLLRCCRFHGCH